MLQINYTGKFVALRIRGPAKELLLHNGQDSDLVPFSGEGKVDGETLTVGYMTRLRKDARIEVSRGAELYCLWFGKTRAGQ